MNCGKWFDKRIAQSSKGQVKAFVVALGAMILAGAIVGHFVLDMKNADNAKFGRAATWGLMQCVDGGFVDATITTNTKTDESDGSKVVSPAPLSVVFLSLGFWLFGAVLMSLFTGAAANFLEARREKIATGDVDYAFDGNFILIVGYDFQVKNLIRKLLSSDGAGANRLRIETTAKPDVVLVTDRDVEKIYDEILPEIDADEERRLYVMRKDIAQADAYQKLSVTKAVEIYLIGDGEASGRDGKILQAQKRIAEKAQQELGGVNNAAPVEPSENFAPIPLYLHIEDSVLYTRLRVVELPTDPPEVKTGKLDEKGKEETRRLRPIFKTVVFNYYESWAWHCWSDKDNDEPYLHLMRPGAKRAELFVIGAGRMGRAMVNFALPLMNYGHDGKRSKVTIFDADPLKKGFLPDKAVLDALPEVEVEHSAFDGCSDEANALMLAAAQREDTSVTVVIALRDPGEAVRAYSELSNQLRRCPISILVWQATHSQNCPDPRYLVLGVKGYTAEKSRMRYFGMTDELPWYNEDKRSKWGAAVDYYYNLWFPYGETPPPSPSLSDNDFARKALGQWDEAKASEQWLKTLRWKKWASVNSADAFRERSVVVSGPVDAATCQRILKAEHNRWWTEKLLSGWQQDDRLAVGDGSHADDRNMLHGDMVPFEQLSDVVKDKDKINPAAMFANGFVEV